MKKLGWLVVVCVCWLSPIAVKAQESVEADSKVGELVEGINTLQPWYESHGQKIANTLAEAIATSSMVHSINPFLALAIARKESSLNPIIGLGLKLGKRGEVGWFQIMPGSVAYRQCANGCDLRKTDCNAEVAICRLDKLREQVGDDPWLYVGCYGRKRCPRSREEAQTWKETKRARRFLCEVVPEDCDEIWPN